jgi:hypothetical protein
MSNTRKEPQTDDLSIQAFGDENPRKKFSNGVRAVLKAIRTSWRKQPSKQIAEPVWFARKFLPKYLEVAKRYSADKTAQNRSVDALYQHIDALERGETQVKFPDIRAFAEFLAPNFPAGLLFLYSHIVSDAARGNDVQSVLNLLDSCATALDALRRYITREGLDGVFKKTGQTSDGIQFYAKIEGLRILTDEYSVKRKVPMH